MGYSPGLLLKIGQFSTLYQFNLYRHKQSRKQSQIILERCWRRFREFGAISRTCQNRPCSKPWAIAQAFCSKSANFRPLRIHPKSTQTVAQAVTNHFRTVLEAFQRVSSDFQDLPKSTMFKTMGYSPGLFHEIGRFSTSSEFTINRHKQSRKQSQIILERFCRRFREFGANSRTCQNRPCSKPWAIAQAFCTKSPDFRPFLIHPKSTQTVAQAVTNHFRTVLQAFQRVWSEFQDLPKSTMFKTMGYSPGLLHEIGRFSTLPN